MTLGNVVDAIHEIPDRYYPQFLEYAKTLLPKGDKEKEAIFDKAIAKAKKDLEEE